MNNTESNRPETQGEGRNASQSREGGSQSESKEGTAAKRAPDNESTASGAYKNETGDPGRTPGTAEGVENFEETGNE